MCKHCSLAHMASLLKYLLSNVCLKENFRFTPICGRWISRKVYDGPKKIIHYTKKSFQSVAREWVNEAITFTAEMKVEKMLVWIRVFSDFKQILPYYRECTSRLERRQ